MRELPIDAETSLLAECYAVVKATRRERQRFQENCVEVVDSAETARERAAGGGRPAVVLGPSRSSEGFRMYYLVRWLDRP